MDKKKSCLRFSMLNCIIYDKIKQILSLNDTQPDDKKNLSHNANCSVLNNTVAI